MRVWADVYTPGGSRYGDGPIRTIRQASITRTLDKAGSFTISLPETDTRAIDLLQNKRRLHIFGEQFGVTRELTRGIVEGMSAQETANGYSLTVDGPDVLEELKFKSVLVGRKYEAQAVQAVVDDLLGLVGGWTRSGTVSNLVSSRFDGSSVLKALQNMIAQQGIHFRMASANVLEIGSFGTDSGLRMFAPTAFPIEMVSDHATILIEKLSIVKDSEDIVNWLVPLGAGQGDAALSLEFSTRTTPYAIQSMTGPDGRTLYFISDAASITSYGQIEKVGTFKDIAPISTSKTDVIQAANALYDAAAAWLTRYSQLQEVYNVTCRKLTQNVMPGDKIHLRYLGVVTDETNTVTTFRNINDDFWIMSLTERFNASGASVTMKIAAVDRHEQSVANVLLGAIESLRVNNVHVQPYFSKDSWKDSFAIDNTHPVIFTVDITNATQALNRAIVRIRTVPFRANVQAAESGGDHVHQVFSTPSGTYGGATTLQAVTAADGPPPSGLTSIALQMINTDSPIYTFGASGDHTHPMVYGIYDDDQHPTNISIYINGVDRTSALGGPWATSGSSLNVELDITEYINLAANLQQSHVVEIRCASNQGLVKIHCELWETVQSIAVFN